MFLYSTGEIFARPNFTLGFLTCVLGKNKTTTYAKLRAYRYYVSPCNPFSNAVSFWGQTTDNLTGLFPKRDCSSKRDKRHKTAVPFWGQTSQIPGKLSLNRDCGPKRVTSKRKTFLQQLSTFFFFFFWSSLDPFTSILTKQTTNCRRNYLASYKRAMRSIHISVSCSSSNNRDRCFFFFVFSSSIRLFPRAPADLLRVLRWLRLLRRRVRQGGEG